MADMLVSYTTSSFSDQKQWRPIADIPETN
jgi:hypothetical protein